MHTALGPWTLLRCESKLGRSSVSVHPRHPGRPDCQQGDWLGPEPMSAPLVPRTPSAAQRPPENSVGVWRLTEAHVWKIPTVSGACSVSGAGAKVGAGVAEQE